LPGKALAGLTALLAAASLLGCGTDNSSTSGAAEGSSTNASSGAAKIAELRQQVREVQAQRRRREEHSDEVRPGHGNSSSADRTSQDSGGGADQFRTSGDNSIQEFGREASASERERAATVLHGYLDSLVSGRWQSACFYMSAGVVVTLERVSAVARNGAAIKSCPDALAALSGGSGGPGSERAADVDVGSLRVDGERSFILYHDAVAGTDYAMPMVLEAGEWKVGSLEGSPLL
jgi:hypothetical protein